jgi:hypothetical protein
MPDSKVRVVPRDEWFKMMEEQKRKVAKDAAVYKRAIDVLINNFEAGRGGRPDHAATESTRRQLRELAASFGLGREQEALEAVRRELVRLTGNQW